MRTVIFLGLLYIGDAIRAAFNVTDIPNQVGVFLAIVLLVVMVMDIVDFLSSKRIKIRHEKNVR